MIKKAYKILELYPGLNNEIEVGDIVVKDSDKSVFYYKLSKEQNVIFENYVYITQKPQENPKFFKEVELNIEIDEK